MADKNHARSQRYSNAYLPIATKLKMYVWPATGTPLNPMVAVVADCPKTTAFAVVGLLPSALVTISRGAFVQVPSWNVSTKEALIACPVPAEVMVILPAESLPVTADTVAVVPYPVIIPTSPVTSAVPRVAPKRLNGVMGVVDPVPPRDLPVNTSVPLSVPVLLGDAKFSLVNVVGTLVPQEKASVLWV